MWWPPVLHMAVERTSSTTSSRSGSLTWSYTTGAGLVYSQGAIKLIMFLFLINNYTKELPDDTKFQL